MPIITLCWAGPIPRLGSCLNREFPFPTVPFGNHLNWVIPGQFPFRQFPFLITPLDHVLWAGFIFWSMFDSWWPTLWCVKPNWVPIHLIWLGNYLKKRKFFFCPIDMCDHLFSTVTLFFGLPGFNRFKARLHATTCWLTSSHPPHNIFFSTAKGYRQEEEEEEESSCSRGEGKVRGGRVIESDGFGYINIIKDLQTADCRDKGGLWVYIVHHSYGPQQLGLGHSTIYSWCSPQVPETGECKWFRQGARRLRESLAWLQKGSSFSCSACL